MKVVYVSFDEMVSSLVPNDRSSWKMISFVDLLLQMSINDMKLDA